MTLLNRELPLAKSLMDRAQSVQLNNIEKTRYARHLLLPEIGELGQRAIKSARVLIVGSGGLGSPAGLYLAAAGVGHLGIVDFDVVDLTNLQRQVVFTRSDLGSSKAEAACCHLTQLNDQIDIVPIKKKLNAGNIADVFDNFDLIVDGTDNFSTRYLINDAGVLLGKPVVYGSIFRFDGQASLFYYPFGPCYRCLFPSAPSPEQVPNCAEGGVLGVLPGIIGLIQATEALKLITGVGESLIGRLLTYDASLMKYGEFSFKKDTDCAVCGAKPTIKSIEEAGVFCGIVPDISRFDKHLEITTEQLNELIQRGLKVKFVDVRSEHERAICSIPESVHIPLGEVNSQLPEFQKDGTIVFYCKSGQRSLTAAMRLHAANRLDVFSLKGGIIAWIAETNSNQALY